MSEEHFQNVTNCSTPSDKSKNKRRGGRKSLFPCNSPSETSPLLQLTDELQTLSTETNRLPPLILPEGGGGVMVGRGVDGEGKKLSMDDGCCLESPAVSTNSSPSSFFIKKPGHKSKFNLMKRFDSDPTNSQSACRLGEVQLCRQKYDDKENMGGLKVISEAGREASKGVHSPTFKSPSSVPRYKRVAFSNETNLINTSNPHHYHSYKQPLKYSSSLRGDVMNRQESVDDGFFDQVFNNNSETPSTKLDLPKNFERLLFSPVLEGSESDSSTPKRPALYSSTMRSVKTMHEGTSHNISTEGFTKIKNNSFTLHDKPSSDSFPSPFQSPVSTKQADFKQPMFLQKSLSFASKNTDNTPQCLTSNNTNRPSEPFKAVKSKFINMRKLLRSESVNHDHNTSSSSDDSLCMEPMEAKRRKNSEEDPQVSKQQLKKCQSMAALSIKSALKRDEICPDLIGDFTREYSLPLVVGRHHDLKCISIHTMANLLTDSYNQLIHDFVIVDCRYPYEFEGGHIKGAINVHTSEFLMQKFFQKSGVDNDSFVPDEDCEEKANDKSIDKSSDSSMASSDDDKENCEGENCKIQSIKNKRKFLKRNQERRSIVVFHCEFSSERGPHMSRFLRSKDREQSCYPKLKYPELYLLEGGYKAFYEIHSDLCEPKAYVQMHHPNFQDQLKLFKGRSLSQSNKSVPKSLWS